MVRASPRSPMRYHRVNGQSRTPHACTANKNHETSRCDWCFEGDTISEVVRFDPQGLHNFRVGVEVDRIIKAGVARIVLRKHKT
jgi:hypothetical protein